MKQVALNAVVSLLVAASCLLAYDRLVFRPSQLIGVVDVSDVYRTKEAEFAALLTAGVLMVVMLGLLLAARQAATAALFSRAEFTRPLLQVDRFSSTRLWGEQTAGPLPQQLPICTPKSLKHRAHHKKSAIDAVRAVA